ncbi:hypothetical protein IWW36_000779 [Coemansia brasiliensis]|uniref:HORMA domain-containing protein n=1 Tax=Coemansia brasiliensis TaxID=2650707 RepID=A0A9W8ICY3_9FUNG|nr:hypothetical protein IWW36_000779 [Coemansia brasiliensis]
MSVSAKMYFSDVLYIAISEIAYYRYLLPESFFEEVLFEDVEVHRLMSGKSTKSDMLLEILPLPVPVLLSSRIILTPNAPQSYMPPSFVPLPPSKMNGYYTMPEFGSAQVGIVKRSGIEGYVCVVSVEGPVQQPPLGSTMCSKPMRIDLDDNPDKRVFVAVPNPIVSRDKAITTRQQQKRCLIDCVRQEPSMPNTHGSSSRQNRDIAEAENGQSCECQIDSCEEMQTCYRCKRKVHTACYVLEGDLTPLVIVCISCQAKNKIAAMPNTLCRLALTRRAARLAYRQKEEQVTWLIKNLGCSKYRGRSIMNTINSLGLIRIDKNVHPNRFNVDENSWQAKKAVLFDSDIESAVAAAAAVPKLKP